MLFSRSALLVLPLVLLQACASTVGGGISPDGSAGDSARAEGSTTIGTDGGPGPVLDVVIPPAMDVSVPPTQTDAAPPPPRDAFPTAPDGQVIYPPDAGYNPGVMCGTAVCNAMQECCPDQMTRMLTCVPAGTCRIGALTCDGPEDCRSDQQCCLGNVQAGMTDPNASRVICRAPTECGRLPFIGTLRPCHTAADCPTTARICCNVSNLNLMGFMLPAGIPQLCSPICPGG